MAENLESALATDRARALELTPVSREIAEKLDRFVEVLREWQPRSNLIAASTLPIVWTRHIADSLQLLPLAPQAKTWIDFGSGAGFPGLIIACALPPDAVVHLVESTGKKATFLREAARHIGAPAEIHAVRIEDFVKKFGGQADVVTARALAPLTSLLGLAESLLKKGALGLFPKGQDVASELTEATKCWKYESSLVPSKTNAQSRVVIVRGLERRNPKR